MRRVRWLVPATRLEPVTSPGSLFDASELARWRSSSRPQHPEATPRVTVVCGCGVLMEVTWARASVVHCFGCGRAFPPPPGAGPEIQWKPELAPDPVATHLTLEPVTASPGRGRVRRALFAVLEGLVLLWLVLRVAHAFGGPAEDQRAPELPLKTETSLDDR